MSRLRWLLIVYALSVAVYAQSPATGIRVNAPAADTTAPTVTITTDGGSGAGANFSTSSTTVDLAGTASDAGRGLSSSPCGWANSLGGSGSTTGTSAWSITAVPLTIGSNVITITCADVIGNQGTDVITVTRSSGSAPSCDGSVVICLSQAGSGSANGTSAANARPISFVNAGNCGSGTSIGAGDTLVLNGTITSTVTPLCNGTSGNTITLYFATGAKISESVCPSTGCLNLASRAFWTIDGGTACGPSVVESTCNGIIEATANGSALANHVDTTVGIWVSDTDSIEIKNLVLKNLYVHTKTPDDENVLDQPYPSMIGGIISPATNISIHDNTVREANWCLSFVGNGGFNNLQIYRNRIYHCDHAVALGIVNQNTTGVEIHDNHYYDGTNWDTVSNALHHDGIHMYTTTSASISATIYNDLCDGDWGTDNTTACLFFETAGSTGTMTITIYNYVCIIQSGVKWNNGCFNNGNDSNSGSRYKAYNNTFIASATNTNYVSQWVQGVDTRNNVLTTRDSTSNGLVVAASSLVSPIFNYNIYASPLSSSAFQLNGVNRTYASWKSTGGFDANSPAGNLFTMPITGLTESTGAISASFPGVSVGLNLCNGIVSCTGNLAALASDTTAGGTRTAVARPTGSTAWDIGAWQH